MIYIYGDSHGTFSFKNLKLNHKNCICNSITMFRIGRDNIIINFDKNIKMSENDIIDVCKFIHIIYYVYCSIMT